MATITHTRRCANCPRMIVVPVRGGRRYCLECADAMRMARLEAIRLGQAAHAESRKKARGIISEELSIFDRERIILGWQREG